MMHIELYGVEEEDRWQEGEWENDEESKVAFGKDPNTRWFVEYSVGLYDSNQPKHLFRKHTHTLDLGGLLLLTVVSPAFKNNPVGSNELREDLRNAPHIDATKSLVMDVFSEERIVEHLKQQLELLQPQSIDDLKEQVEGFLTISYSR